MPALRHRRAAASSRRSRRGFTLLEVLLVLAVLAVLVAVTTFAVPDISADAVDEAARRVASACDRARAIALREGVRVRLTIDVEAGEYRLVGETDPVERPGEFADFPDDVSAAERLPEGVRFAAPQIGPLRLSDRPPEAGATVSIEFETDGTADAAVIELAFADRADRRRWVVLEPLTGSASVALEQPELPERPAEARWAEGVAGDRTVLLDRLFVTGNGLGGKNPNTVYSPQNRLGRVQLIEEDEASRPEPTYDLLPTLPGR